MLALVRVTDDQVPSCKTIVAIVTLLDLNLLLIQPPPAQRDSSSALHRRGRDKEMY